MAGEGIIVAQRYRLDNELAAGATGRVWLALDILLRRPVAVKMLRPAYAADAAVLERFRAVARQAASVAHRNVAAVHDYGEGGPEGAPYVVSELVEGKSAADVLAASSSAPRSSRRSSGRSPTGCTPPTSPASCTGT